MLVSDDWYWATNLQTCQSVTAWPRRSCTCSRDCVSVNELHSPSTVLSMLPSWFADSNSVHPHQSLNMVSPRQLRQTQASPKPVTPIHQLKAAFAVLSANVAVVV